MAVCAGNSYDHCCWISGVACEHLEENTVEGRRWACGLLRQLGSWESVHSSDEYAEVRVMIRSIGIEVDCGDWPPSGVTCGTCGVSGDG